MSKFFSFNKAITIWFNENKRNLPWRLTRDPYKIWVSEIMLQQTRVNQAIQYYNSFIEKFGTLKILAKADINDVMKMWQGLGYYSRVRNMHETANKIVNEFDSKFPDSYDSIIKLKGVGRYTAAAIASICFNESVPVIDGNVFRVISRYKGISTAIDSSKAYPEFSKNASELMGISVPGIFNQAIMELGALICLPVNANCGICPVATNCFARKNNLISMFPVKLKQAKVRIRYFNYLVIFNGHSVVIKKRLKNDIWKLLFDFPLIESDHDLKAEDLFNFDEFKYYTNMQKMHTLKTSDLYLHKLSHQVIYARFYKFELKDISHMDWESHTDVDFDRILDYPVPRLIEKYLSDEFGVIKKMHYISGHKLLK